MDDPQVDVSIVTVSYQCRDELLGLLESITAHPSTSSVEVHVVDNASTDGTVQAVRSRFPDVDVVQTGYNAGFAVANNAGIARSRGRYVFLLNPDTRVTDGCIDTLVAFMDAEPAIAAAGPKLLNRDLTLQYSIRNLPTLRGSILEAVLLHHLFPRALARYGEMVFDERAYRYPHPVGWVSGAAMFVRKDELDRVGLLDEDFFLYSEEIDWFKRMSDLGMAVWFVPDAVVIHREDKGDPDPHLTAIDVDSRRRYWRKHTPGVRADLAMAVLGLNMALRYTACLVLSLGGDERALKRKTALASGLRALRADGVPARPVKPATSMTEEGNR